MRRPQAFGNTGFTWMDHINTLLLAGSSRPGFEITVCLRALLERALSHVTSRRIERFRRMFGYWGIFERKC